MSEGGTPSETAGSPIAPWRFLVLGAAALAASAITLQLSPATQDPSYHLFADARRLFGIPNFADTVSNIAFVLAGAFGLTRVFGKAEGTFETGRERWPYGFIFGGSVLVGMGSAYYHLGPDDISLFWDRLPMTVVFMAIFASVVMERLDRDAGLVALPFLLSLGVASAVWWHLTGDLRPYVMVQFFPLLLIPALLLLLPSRYRNGGHLWYVLLLYAGAKGAEVLDRPVFESLGIVSGHTAKHLLAAGAIVVLARMVQGRGPVSRPA